MHSHRRLLRVIAWIAISAFGTTQVLADAIVLATAPLITGIGKNVSPNILFILDDSASMPANYMPDTDPSGNSVNGNSGKNCFRNFGYNTIYYNPSTTYTPPLGNDGVTQKADASFTGAWEDGYDTGGTGPGTQDLSATPNYTPTPTTSGPFTLLSNPFTTTTASGQQKNVTVTHNGHGRANGDKVTITGVAAAVRGIPANNFNNVTFTISNVATNSYRITVATNATSAGTGGGSGVKVTYTYNVDVITSYTPNYYYYSYTSSPNSPPNTCASDALYTKVDPTVTTAMGRSIADEKKNFANWYSYYRTRLLMVKTASGRAFSSLGPAYRVGYTVTSEKGMTAGKFLEAKKFDTAQRTSWYTTLNGLRGNDVHDDTYAGTPLRGALSKAGRYYAGTLKDTTGTAIAGTNKDPVQYSCQQNFAILATDGFWNLNGEASSGTVYGAYKENNSTLVGDQDSGSAVLRPFKDALAKSNTLADVAYYYYTKDLRATGGPLGGLNEEGNHIDVSTNNVPTSNTDTAFHQHMTTYTLGLGLSDLLTFPTDYANILSGAKSWPDPKVTDTPITVAGRVDDLWHAGVNGHGQYFSAKDPGSVQLELGKALQSIRAVIGSSSAAATSNLQPVSGDNTAFIAQYKTVAWTGDVVARSIDVLTAAVSTTNIWSAQTLLDSQSTRFLYTFSGSATNHLREFKSANLTAEISAGYFKSDSGNPGGALPQTSTWNPLQTAAATQPAMIDYLRGVRMNEDKGTATATDLFRPREHVLGDIVSAAPAFVRKPPFRYSDSGYLSFISSNASRVPTVYVGSNDGMLHAFDGTTGQSGSGKERWAYIPTAVVKDLYKLADSSYSLNHRFYVDGPITVGDAYSGSGWGTVLVGGLGGGGKGYYALDITDPANPKALWEFSTATDYTGDVSYDADIGYSYGNPVITKRALDGKWVVIFASGYNNTSGDKKGRLYVVDAFTGEKLSEIITGTTANENLSGIARVSNFVSDSFTNNSTQYVYGGDLSGALWRFDINANTVQKLGNTSGTAGAQPITMKPELGKISAGTTTYPVVYFGTGRYLSPNDLSDDAPSTAIAQAIYAVKDTGADLGVLTDTSAKLVSQTLDDSTSPRTSTSNAVDWSDNNGWYVTTPVGERFTIDPGLQLGNLVIAANIPATDYCKPTGASVLYQLSYKTGFVMKTNAFQSQVVGNTQVQVGTDGSGSGSGGKVPTITVHADGSTSTTDPPPPPPAGSVTRVSWREIE